MRKNQRKKLLPDPNIIDPGDINSIVYRLRGFQFDVTWRISPKQQYILALLFEGSVSITEMIGLDIRDIRKAKQLNNNV